MQVHIEFMKGPPFLTINLTAAVVELSCSECSLLRTTGVQRQQLEAAKGLQMQTTPRHHDALHMHLQGLAIAAAAACCSPAPCCTYRNHRTLRDHLQKDKARLQRFVHQEQCPTASGIGASTAAPMPACGHPAHMPRTEGSSWQRPSLRAQSVQHPPKAQSAVCSGLCSRAPPHKLYAGRAHLSAGASTAAPVPACPRPAQQPRTGVSSWQGQFSAVR